MLSYLSHYDTVSSKSSSYIILCIVTNLILFTFAFIIKYNDVIVEFLFKYFYTSHNLALFISFYLYVVLNCDSMPGMVNNWKIKVLYCTVFYSLPQSSAPGDLPTNI